MLSKLAETDARSTLEAAGYTGRLRRGEILRYSPPDFAENTKVHEATNELLLKVLITADVGDCIHITGKMNALADPLHRRICAEVARRTKTRFAVVYQSEATPTETAKIALKSARRWSRARWIDKLAAVRLIGDEFVDVKTTLIKEAIQYTVFGNRFTQLQAKHPDAGMSAKQIWLIRSEAVTDFLTDKARTTLKASADIKEAAFKDFFAQMSGVTSHNILATLSDRGPSQRSSVLTPRLSEFDPEAGEVLDALESFSFVASDANDALTITESGKQFISYLK